MPEPAARMTVAGSSRRWCERPGGRGIGREFPQFQQGTGPAGIGRDLPEQPDRALGGGEAEPPGDVALPPMSRGAFSRNAPAEASPQAKAGLESSRSSKAGSRETGIFMAVAS